MTSVPFESVIALDGLRIIVSRQNPVDALSRDQIARIFSGEITNWSDVDGRPGRINLYVRDTESGTRDTFGYLVMKPRGSESRATRTVLNPLARWPIPSRTTHTASVS